MTPKLGYIQFQSLLQDWINYNVLFFLSMCICSTNQKLACAQQQLTEDYDKLKAEDAEKTNKLQQTL